MTGTADRLVKPAGLEDVGRQLRVEFDPWAEEVPQRGDIGGRSVRKLHYGGLPLRPAEFSKQQELHRNGAVEDLFRGAQRAVEQRIPQRRELVAEVERQRQRTAVVQIEMKRPEPKRVSQGRTVLHQLPEQAERIEPEPASHLKAAVRGARQR